VAWPGSLSPTRGTGPPVVHDLVRPVGPTRGPEKGRLDTLDLRLAGNSSRQAEGRPALGARLVTGGPAQSLVGDEQVQGHPLPSTRTVPSPFTFPSGPRRNGGVLCTLAPRSRWSAGCWTKMARRPAVRVRSSACADDGPHANDEQRHGESDGPPPELRQCTPLLVLKLACARRLRVVMHDKSFGYAPGLVILLTLARPLRRRSPGCQGIP